MVKMCLNVGAGKDLRFSTSEEQWWNLDRVYSHGSSNLPVGDGDERLVARIGCDLGRTNSGLMSLVEENTFDYVLCSHVVEHLPGDQFLRAMEDLWLAAKPDAVMEVHVPYVGSDDAFEDPTHVRHFGLDSFIYLAQPYYWRADYGYYGDWETTSRTLLMSTARFCESFPASLMEIPETVLRIARTYRNVVEEFHVTLRAVKPPRPQDKDLRTSVPVGIAWVP